MATQLGRRGVACWAYCLTPNHVHFILTPEDEAGLALAVGEAHRRYTGFVSARGGRTAHLFQGRFASVAMDEEHLMAAFRYVALNPVKAGLAARAADWPWSSVGAHIAGRDTALCVGRARAGAHRRLRRLPGRRGLSSIEPQVIWTRGKSKRAASKVGATAAAMRPLGVVEPVQARGP